MSKKFLELKDISAYRIAFQLSQTIWPIVLKWDHFAKDTIGKQFVRAIDSIAANIAEGFGRYSKKEKIQFYRYSYGSISESVDWNEKAKGRGLFTSEQYELISSELKKLPREIHYLIVFTEEKISV